MPVADQQQRTALHRRAALKTAALYAVVACLWIYLSDMFLELFIQDPRQLTQAQTIKGALYVIVTSALLYLYLGHCLQSLRKQEDRLKEEQERIQQEVAERFQQLNTLFNSMNAVVYVADLETYELLYVNKCAIEHFGSSWQGRKCFHYLQSGIEEPCAFCTNPQLLTNGEPGDTVTWEFKNLKNQRWYECFDKAILWTNGRLARLEIAFDITERKELERIKDELLSSISHEMRTPLTAISGFAELLLNEPELPQHHRKHLEIVLREAEKLSELINRFLDARRLKINRSRINYRDLVVAELLEKALQGTRDCKAKHDIRIDCQADVMVFGNSKELIQVFSQLLENACRYSPEGGEIVVRAETVADETILCFSDLGLGIPHHELDNIFQPFHRLDTGDNRRTGGVGLGLSVANEIISLHGGEIRVESTPGKGSTFKIILPLPNRRASASDIESTGPGQT